MIVPLNGQTRSVFNPAYNEVELLTRDGSEFTAKQYTEEIPSWLYGIYSAWKTTYGVQELLPPTSAFDGHSYAWYMRSTENEYYFDSYIAELFSLDSHTEEIEAFLAGTLIFYTPNDHETA